MAEAGAFPGSGAAMIDINMAAGKKVTSGYAGSHLMRLGLAASSFTHDRGVRIRSRSKGVGWMTNR